jgi:DNA-binding transcriptional regulator YhcF (GntR family)
VIVAVDFTLSTPPYEQIRTAIAGAVARRKLAPGTRLPTVRQLARDLSVSPATVAHAYQELERDGVVYGAGRKGTFVAETAADDAPVALDTLAREFVRSARRAGADRATILHTLIDVLDAAD